MHLTHHQALDEPTPTPDLPSDSLGKFLVDAHHNIAATIANLRRQYDPLARIDQVYCDMIDNLNQSPEFVAGFFLIILITVSFLTADSFASALASLTHRVIRS